MLHDIKNTKQDVLTKVSTISPEVNTKTIGDMRKALNLTSPIQNFEHFKTFDAALNGNRE